MSLKKMDAPPGLEPGLFGIKIQRVANYTKGQWYGMTGSNRRHSACKADALPTELIPRNYDQILSPVI
jgi:hypothetical protein